MHGDSHDIYLCQVSETVSCGACCGLYNLPNVSREMLEVLLSKRTEDFASVPRTEDGIYEFKIRNKGPHRLSRPFPEFHHCPFLGLIGAENTRVGCLLHPTLPGNNGVDFRSLSWYGERACSTYLCPATYKLPAIYKTILIQTIDNWYAFGLVVTEHVLIGAYFKEVECRIGRPVTARDYMLNNGAKDAFRDFVELKCQWPYQRADNPGPCNYFFDNGQYPGQGCYRNTSHIHLSSYEIIFRNLKSDFSSIQEIAAAEQILDDLFLRTEGALL